MSPARLRLLATLIGLLAVLSMHGLTSHAGSEGDSAADQATAVDHAPGGEHHDHQDGGGPCSCCDGTAATCAHIVLAVSVTPTQIPTVSPVRAVAPAQPRQPVASLDPPVPRRVLVT